MDRTPFVASVHFISVFLDGLKRNDLFSFAVFTSISFYFQEPNCYRNPIYFTDFVNAKDRRKKAAVSVLFLGENGALAGFV